MHSYRKPKFNIINLLKIELTYILRRNGLKMHTQKTIIRRIKDASSQAKWPHFWTIPYSRMRAYMKQTRMINGHIVYAEVEYRSMLSGGGYCPITPTHINKSINQSINQYSHKFFCLYRFHSLKLSSPCRVTHLCKAVSLSHKL